MPSAASVVDASENYSRAVLRSIGGSVGVAVLLFSVQAVIALQSSLAPKSQQGPAVPYPSLTLQDSGGALAFLLPASIALQVLLRLARAQVLSKEAAAAEVAQRQFWGTVAGIVAMAAAFIALGSFADGFVSGLAGSTLDLKRVFGVPLGALIAMLFATDAAALAQQEARALELDTAYRDRECAALDDAAQRVSGVGYRHPRRRFAWQSALVCVCLVFTCAATAFALVQDAPATFVFTCTSLAVTAFTVWVLPGAAVYALRGKPLDMIMQIFPPIAVAGVFASQLIGFALPLVREKNDPWAYIAPIGYGLLLFAPIMLTPLVLSVPRSRIGRPAPLLDLARKRLTDEARRLRKYQERAAKRPTWAVLAWVAIGASVFPPIGFALAGAAAIHRSRGDAKRSKLFRASWIVPAAFMLVEAGALLFLPVLAVAFGWVSST